MGPHGPFEPITETQAADQNAMPQSCWYQCSMLVSSLSHQSISHITINTNTLLPAARYQTGKQTDAVENTIITIIIY